MTIREFLKTVWDAKVLVAAALVLVLIGAWVYVDVRATVYGSQATVRIVAPAAAGEGTAAKIAVTTDDVLATAVTEAAATELGMAPEKLRPLVSAEPGSDDGSILVIRARSTDAELAHDAAQAVAEAFVAYVPTLRDQQVEALLVQKATYTAENANVEAALEADPLDALLGADQEAIVARYSEIQDQILGLRSIAEPGELIQTASPPQVEGFPLRTVMPVAVLAGLLAGVALALAKRGLDNRVRTSADAQRLTDLPVLAELSDVRDADQEYRRDGALPVASRTATPFTESIRELRTAIQVTAGTDPHVVVVTAADPRAPRSFITANLAASLALSGLRTVVVAGDMRRTELLELLPAPEGWSGDERGVRPSRIPNLEVLRISSDRMDPADYLAGAGVRDAVEQLRRRADVVLVDAPPVLVAADATILGGYSDGVVLVAAAGRTERGVLTDAAERLRINDVPTMGVVLAGFTGNRRRRYVTRYEAEAPVTGLGRLLGSRTTHAVRPGHPGSRPAPAQPVAVAPVAGPPRAPRAAHPGPVEWESIVGRRPSEHRPAEVTASHERAEGA